jgi:hypothetical protein
MASLGVRRDGRLVDVAGMVRFLFALGGLPKEKKKAS